MTSAPPGLPTGRPHVSAPASPDAAPGLLLPPGHPLSLSPASDGRWLRAQAMGVKPGEFLIVRPPATLPAECRAEGARLLVRLEEHGVVYGFETTVLCALKLPRQVLFLSWPRRFESRALRRHPRHQCLIPAMVEVDGSAWPGHVRDLSLGGCLVVADGSLARHIRPGDGDRLDVCLPVEGLRVERLRGQVRRRTVEDGVLRLGLSFLDVGLGEGAREPGAAPAVAGFMERVRWVDELREPQRPAPHPGGSACPPGHALDEAIACVEDSSQVRLKCLEPLELQFTGNHLYERSSILGVDGADLVIAEMPVGYGLRNCPKPGMGLRARFQAHGSYYGFMTCVAKFLTRPRPLVLLTYPKKIEILMRRRHPRVACMVPATAVNEHCRASGYVTDISVGGCRMLARLEGGEPILNVMTGDKVEVSMPLEGLRPEKIRARISSLGYEAGAVSLGLAFDADKRQADRLARFVDRLEEASG